MSRLLLDMQVINFPRYGLLNILADSKMVLSGLFRRDNLLVVHIHLFGPVVDFTSVELSVDLLSEVSLGYKIASFLSADESVHLSVNANVFISKFISELVHVDLALLVLLDFGSHLLLEGVDGVAGGAHFAGLASVELDVVGSDWGFERVVLIGGLVVPEMLRVKSETLRKPLGCSCTRRASWS